MEKINVLEENPASIVLMNLLGDYIEKNREQCEKSNIFKLSPNPGDVKVELKINGLVIPAKKFFEDLWKNYSKEVDKAALVKVKEYVKLSESLEKVQDLNLFIEDTISQIRWGIGQKIEKELGIQINY